MALAFDATALGAGQVILSHSHPSDWGLTVHPDPNTRSWSPIYDMADGEHTTVSAGRYRLGIHGELHDAEEARWLYYYDAANTPHEVTAGGSVTLQSGGLHSASMAAGQASYRPGANVGLTPHVADGYGNRLYQISYGPSQSSVKGHLVVRDPQGNIVYEGDIYLGATSWFALSRQAAKGTYQASLEVNWGRWGEC